MAHVSLQLGGMIARSIWRKALVTALAVVGFVSTYEVTILDSKYAAEQAAAREATASPTPGAKLSFSATAYCKGETTASGAGVHSGIAAADPELLPVGSVINIQSLPGHYNGIYTVLDTGPAVQGRQVDLYMWSCVEAMSFGRQPIHVTVLRLGWNPRATTPTFLDKFFRKPVGAAN